MTWRVRMNEAALLRIADVLKKVSTAANKVGKAADSIAQATDSRTARRIEKARRQLRWAGDAAWQSLLSRIFGDR